MVSGSFHSPHRGSFHFSLTLLVAIGRREVLSLAGWSPRIHTGFHVSGATWEQPRKAMSFRLRGCHSLRQSFPEPSARSWLFDFLADLWFRRWCPTTPVPQRPQPWHGTGLGSSRFARRYSGSRGFFPFLEVLRCFNSLRSLPHGYGFTVGCQGTTPGAFPHLRDPRIKACLAAPRGLSQLCHVFRRLSTPKHPPRTLSCLVLSLCARSASFYTSCLIVKDLRMDQSLRRHDGGPCRHPSVRKWWRRRGSNP